MSSTVCDKIFPTLDYTPTSGAIGQMAIICLAEAVATVQPDDDTFTVKNVVVWLDFGAWTPVGVNGVDPTQAPGVYNTFEQAFEADDKVIIMWDITNNKWHAIPMEPHLKSRVVEAEKK